MTARPLDGFTAAVATIAAVLGLTTLTENSSWFGHAIWTCLVAAGAGALLRRVARHRALVLAGQLVLTGWFVVAVFATDRLWYGLPGPGAWQRVGELAAECATVMQRYAAPIPATEGVQLVLVASIGALAVVVDVLAVTCESPGLAGMPLLAAFLTAAANSGSSLSPWYFLLAAALWLVLVSRQGRWRVRRWSTTVASPVTPTADSDVETEALSGYGSTARQLGVAAVLLAVLLPALIPHLPTRYVLDGLGRGDNSVGRGNRVGFSSTLDLSRSLEGGDRSLVLTYRTSAPAPAPLRVVVATTYSNGDWTQRAVTATQSLSQTRVIAPQVKVVDRQLDVDENLLGTPHVAAVQPVVATNLGGAWYSDAGTGDLYAPDRPDAYSLTYREVAVTGEQLQAGIAGASSGRGDPEVQAATLVDGANAAELTRVTGTVTEGTRTPYDAAVAIQDWLRSKGGFTYSLQLPASVTDDRGAQISDPILRFLRSKQGYCVQFASTMVMMARTLGIPARVAIGFLPGSLENDVYTVRSSDAHAWPELYFPGAGWLRFEPTPAVRTGAAPAYTVISSTPVPGATTAAPTDSVATGAATSTARDPGLDLDGPVVETSTSWSDRAVAWLREPLHLVLLAILLGALGSLVLPVTARLVNRRRRARAATPAELAEAQWDELVSRLGDLGVSEPGGGNTLRQSRTHYTREAYLDPEAETAMQHVVATLERSRYARPGSPPAELADDIRVVTKAASSNRPVLRRVRAFFLPQDGLRWWSAGLTRVVDAPGRWVDDLVDRLPRRR